MGSRAVGVFPGPALTARPRLFGALAAAVTAELVEGFGPAPGDLAAAVVVDDPALAPGQAAELATDLAGRGIHCLLTGPPPSGDPRHRLEVRFGSSSLLDDRLRDRVLHEEGATATRPVACLPGDIVLAASADGPVWIARRVNDGVLHHTACALTELGPSERLKDHLRAGRFLSLLPAVHILRDALAASGWDPPPRRASFIVDDPNLHWSSYGYLRFPVLAAHAARHHYHLGIAMVPADAAFAHRATVATFRRTSQLSVVVHGNDHRKGELSQPQSEEAALAVVAHALRRTAAFERRHGLAIDRVMVPPHARCSEVVMRALRTVGFEAICYEGAGQDQGDAVLAGWQPADTHQGEGLPRMRRLGLNQSIDELVLRAFLDQALVLSGHHTDLADLDRLAEAAALVESLGPVQWMSLGGLSRSNRASRREGVTLRIRAYSRRMVLNLPEGVDQVAVEAPPSSWSAEDHVRLMAGAAPGERFRASGRLGEPLPAGGFGIVEISLLRPGDVDPGSVPPPPWRPWPMVRRCMTQGRDRLQPLVHRDRLRQDKRDPSIR